MDVEVTIHIAPGMPETPVMITAEGGVGMGLDHSLYVIHGVDISKNPQEGLVPDSRFSMEADEKFHILFQNGPIPEVGHNGVTIEHLLAICGHRLEEFQTGPFASDYNARALEHIKGAIAALNQRTLDRLARQVEGTYEK